MQRNKLERPRGVGTTRFLRPGRRTAQIFGRPTLVTFTRQWCAFGTATDLYDRGAYLKALSMMQPYAWLFANGYLKVDDRTWSTIYRGPVAIHASQNFDAGYYAMMKKHTNWALPPIESFSKGGFVAIAQLTDCREPTASIGSAFRKPDISRSHLGAPGHYGFVFEEMKEVPFVPARGNKGLYDVRGKMLTALMDAVALA